mmetsp:Transcript_26145/g.63758  ORF Transcript_26145/g.63758 Transcript_26145/m.63758 type:complete len:82 (-) Transcript_26145:267-512(-)
MIKGYPVFMLPSSIVDKLAFLALRLSRLRLGSPSAELPGTSHGNNPNGDNHKKQGNYHGDVLDLSKFGDFINSVTFDLSRH